MKRIPLLLVIFVAVLLLPPAASAAPAVPDEFLQPGGDHPLGAWDGVPSAPAAAAIDALWSLRTGFRKGITNQSLVEEMTAAPDVAVLRSGFFASWNGLLAGYGEPFVLVEPDALAGLSAANPVLIIPSGGLAGLAQSDFFRAGLAEFAGSGGVVLCFSQQKGTDLSALPASPGSKPAVSGAGWSEDHGPLFRASTIRDFHPVLSGLTAEKPSLETDGYLLSWPPDASVLLARPDGHPTLVLYPIGKGWVVVSMLASDYAFGRGALERDEQVLVRDLILWAKAGGRIAAHAAGKQLDVQLTVRGPEQGNASAVRILVRGPAQQRPVDDRVFPLPVRAMRQATVPYSCKIPPDTAPGIYHIEYVLLDDAERPLSPSAEASEGWFSVLPALPKAAETAPPPATLPPPRVGIEAIPSIDHRGERTRMNLGITGNGVLSGPNTLLVRAAGQERTVTLDRTALDVPFDLGTLNTEQPVVYSVHFADGRTMARGTIVARPPRTGGLAADRPWYAPGGTIRALAGSTMSGEITITGPGTEQQALVNAGTIIPVPVPEGLPLGIYPVSWELQSASGVRETGTVPVMIKGTAVRCTGAAVVRQKDHTAEARFEIDATAGIPAILTFRLVGPDGTSLPPAEKTIALKKGTQTVSQTFSFKPGHAGIWRLLYRLTTTLPEGPGLPREPATVAAGSAAVDAGDAAVIGLRTDRPVYYDTEHAPVVTAYVLGKNRTRIDLLLDGKRVRKDKTDGPGLVLITTPLQDLARGRRIVTAEAGGDLKDRRELVFLYGARLPDLSVIIRTAEPVTSVMEVSLGVVNQGRVPAGGSEVSLYEGDRGRKDALIRTVAVPPLEPGKQYVVVVPWPLAGKAGSRTLVAVADQSGLVSETQEENNRASVTIDVAPFLVVLRPDKYTYAAGEEMRYEVSILNLSSRPLPSPRLDLSVHTPSGAVVSRETVTLPDLPSGEERTLARTLGLTSPPEGTYLVTARASSNMTVSQDSAGINVQPTLLLTGSLDGTAGVAAPCMPFDIRYAVRNAGNVPPVNGTLRIEIRSTEEERLVYAQQLPFALQPGSVRIDPVDLPRGEYTIIFRGSAVNPQWNMEREFLFARQPLAVSVPVEVERSRAAVPRVLVWTGGEKTTTIEQAIAEKLAKETFEGQAAYWTMVTSSEDFRTQALTGLFNSYVLIEITELGDAIGLLTRGLALGHGVFIIGTGEHSRAVAEALGFRIISLHGNATSLIFPEDTVLELTGSVPAFGPVMTIAKSGAKAIAHLPDKQPAALLDAGGPGRTIVAPFPIIQSTLSTGISIPYSLLLRAGISVITPEKEQGGPAVAAVQLRVSSRTGPVKTRIIEALPPDAKVVWTSDPGTAESGSYIIETTADREARSILYLYRTNAPAPAAAGEVFYECRGRFVSQGASE